MSGIKHNKREPLLINCKVAKYGSYEIIEQLDNLVVNTKPIKTIDEASFYKTYLELNNVIRYKYVNGKLLDMMITDAPLELMAHLMAKDSSYTLVFRNKDAKLAVIAEELDKTVNSVYNSMSKLKKAGYLVVTEDGLIAPNQECLDLMSKTKDSIANKEHFTFDFLFKFCVK